VTGYGGQDPYGGYGYNYGYGYGPPGVPGGGGSGASQGLAIGALVCNIILIFFCWLLAIPGIILAALALGKINTEPGSARTLTIWAWVLFAVGIFVGVGVLAVYFILLANAGSGT